MIRYSLLCDQSHEFEAWFSSSADFDKQSESGMVSCAICGSTHVKRALMAPAVSTARRRQETRALMLETAHREAAAKIREIVATIRANSDDVGERFPEEARKIHYGEADARGLIGRATADEARALIEEGIEIAPLPVLPDDAH